MVTIGERINYLRNQKGISMSDLAKAIESNSSAISAWENNQKNPSTNSVIAMAEYFNVSLDWLLKGEEFKLTMNIPTELEGEHKDAISTYERIREVIEEKGFSFVDIEEDIKIPFAEIGKWRRGVMEPSKEYLSKIADYLDVSLDWLSTGKIDGEFQSDEKSQESIDFEKLDKKDIKTVYSADRTKTSDNVVKKVMKNANESATQVYGRIKSLANENSMSIKDVSELAGVSTQTISRWRDGKSDPSYHSLRSIATVLDVPYKYLSTGETGERDLADIVLDPKVPDKDVLISEGTRFYSRREYWVYESFSLLSERDKREVEEIIKMKLRLSKELDE
ncbi:hypothetical protein GCM10008931_42700 [Oceanobacillus oncorhynchi subsp. oncorhynchi]|uniref:helix-turn-helix domain-containing protein n=1 Tax=Oceanobacillus oncorhynchi TaxID=545501 RepID=UPI0031D33C73